MPSLQYLHLQTNRASILQNLLCGKFTINPVYDSSQKIHLIRSKALGLLLEQRRVPVDYILICRLEILFKHKGMKQRYY